MEEARERRLKELKEANDVLDKIEKEIQRLSSERNTILSQRERIAGAIAQLDELMKEPKEE